MRRKLTSTGLLLEPFGDERLELEAPLAAVVEEIGDLDALGVGQALLRDDDVVDILHEIAALGRAPRGSAKQQQRRSR